MLPSGIRAMALPDPTDPMSGQSLSPDAKDAAEDRRTIERLLVFFALVYVVEGFGQVVGLIAQPLSFYLKEVYGWTALQVSAYLTIFNFPWIIKPIYGAFSDFVPLFGYRRKPYLLAANVVAAGAFFWVTQLTAPDRLVLGARAHRLRHGDIEHRMRGRAGGERAAARRERPIRQSAMAVVQRRHDGRLDRRRRAHAAPVADCGAAYRCGNRRRCAVGGPVRDDLSDPGQEDAASTFRRCARPSAVS